MKYKVLIAHSMHDRPLQTQHPDVEVHDLPNSENKYETLLNIIADYDGLLAKDHLVDQRLLDQAKNLKIVANYGVGYDKVDAAYAKQKGIAVSNTPQSTSIVTANFTMGLILSLLRKIVTTDRWVRQGGIIPSWGHASTLGSPIGGSTLGIIGMGRIGKAVAHRALAFDMKVLYHNRNQLSLNEEQALGVQYASFDEILSQSDILTIHTPLTPSTKGMMDKAAFAKLKKGSFLINTSRGAVLDQDILIEALKSGHLAGAALDVFTKEPNVPDVLKTMDNVILTPHNGSGTHAARHSMFEEALGNIIGFLTGGEMTSRVA